MTLFGQQVTATEWNRYEYERAYNDRLTHYSAPTFYYERHDGSRVLFPNPSTIMPMVAVTLDEYRKRFR